MSRKTRTEAALAMYWGFGDNKGLLYAHWYATRDDVVKMCSYLDTAFANDAPHMPLRYIGPDGVRLDRLTPREQRELERNRITWVDTYGATPFDEYPT